MLRKGWLEVLQLAFVLGNITDFGRHQTSMLGCSAFVLVTTAC